MDSIGRPELGAAGPRSAVVVLDGTGMRTGSRRLGVDCNIALGVTARTGPRRRRHAATALLGLTLAQPWSAMAAQLRTLDPPAVGVIVDGELAISRTGRDQVWPDVPIQRCWWHLPRALRWALYPDKAPHRWANSKRTELVALLRRIAGQHLTHAQALARYDTFTATVRAEGHHAASELLTGARDQASPACSRPSAATWPTSAAPNRQRPARTRHARTQRPHRHRRQPMVHKACAT